MTMVQTVMNKHWLAGLLAFVLLFSLEAKAAEASKSRAWLNSAIDKRKAGEHWQAVELLFKLREQHLAHKRINLELVLNFIQLRQYDRAESILIYLESLTLNELEQQKLTKLKQILTRRMRKPISAHRWIVDVGASVGYDVVNNTFPVLIIEDYQSEDSTWLGDDLLDQLWEEADFGDFEYTDGYDIVAREDEVEKQESSYLSEFANINYRYRPLAPLSWFDSATHLIWDNDVSVEFRQIDDDAKNKYSRYSADSSLYLLRVNQWLAEFSGKISIHYNGDNKLLTDTRERVAISFPYKQHKLKLALDVSQKHYQSTLSASNSKTSMPWLEYGYLLSDKFRTTVGVKYKQLRANDNFLSYDRRNFYAGLYYYPLTDLSAYLTINYYQLRYSVDDPDIANWSKENKRSIAFGTKYHVSEHLSISLNGHYSKNTIELGFGEDEWQRIEASLIYRF